MIMDHLKSNFRSETAFIIPERSTFLAIICYVFIFIYICVAIGAMSNKDIVAPISFILIILSIFLLWRFYHWFFLLIMIIGPCWAGDLGGNLSFILSTLILPIIGSQFFSVVVGEIKTDNDGKISHITFNSFTKGYDKLIIYGTNYTLLIGVDGKILEIKNGNEKIDLNNIEIKYYEMVFI